MKATTATAVMRAGLAIRCAIQLVDEDDTAPAKLSELMHSLDRLADRLVDVPMPPPAQLEAEELSRMTSATCPSCGLARIVTPLSTPECPRCHHVHQLGSGS